MTFEAVEGEPLGPKFPLDIAKPDLDGLLGVVGALATYRPGRRWFGRLSVANRLRSHVREGVMIPTDAEAVQALASRSRLSFRFSHGYVTARNVLRDADGRLVLIDWEWAGLYPRGYETAFLWFSLIDVPDARTAVRRSIAESESVAS